jgi:hypothetical protein
MPATAKQKKTKAKDADFGVPKIEATDPRLWNMSQLAECLGVPIEHIRAMKKAGFTMPLGRSTIGMAHKWLEKNAGLLDMD